MISTNSIINFFQHYFLIEESQQQENKKIQDMHHELNTAYTRNYIWIQGRFDKFTHTYLCTRRTYKDCKGTVVNQAMPSSHGGYLEITLLVPSKMSNFFYTQWFVESGHVYSSFTLIFANKKNFNIFYMAIFQFDNLNIMHLLAGWGIILFL